MGREIKNLARRLADQLEEEAHRRQRILDAILEDFEISQVKGARIKASIFYETVGRRLNKQANSVPFIKDIAAALALLPPEAGVRKMTIGGPRFWRNIVPRPGVELASGHEVFGRGPGTR